MPNIEKRTAFFACEVRAEQDEANGAVVTGRPIVYGSTYDNGWFNETIDRGALDKTDLSDVRFLVNHNIDMIPLARSRKGDVNSTMQLTPGEDGLDIRVSLDVDNNQDAKSLYSAIKRGDISGMSFMFTVDGCAWDDLDSDCPTRRITSISKVYEVSAVTFPAYEDTSISARSKEDLQSARSTLENAKNLELYKLKNKILGGI